MNEITILYMLALILASIFSMTALKMWYTLRSETNLKVKVNGLLTEMGKIKSWKRDVMNGELSDNMGLVGKQASGAIIPDLSNMTIEGAAEMLGISKKDLNNPILKPILEKIFKQVKSGQIAQAGNENQEVIEGY